MSSAAPKLRSTIIDVYKSPHGYWHLVCSPAESVNTYIVTIDPFSGCPLYQGIEFVDLFADYSMAVHFVVSNFNSTLYMRGVGLIGIASSDNTTTIAVVDQTEVTGWMPGGHCIQTIRNVNYIRIPVSPARPPSPCFEEFQLQNNHIFCDTYDLTRLFPSTYPASDPDTDFIWNNEWTLPFANLGIRCCCISMVQGLGTSASDPKFNFTMTYIIRRSVLNPGTRYFARGLNDLNSPGNEVECELLFEKGNHFWTSRWRRGSIPIRWETVLDSKLSSPKHTVSTDYSKGTNTYFQGLHNRFGSVPIRCVSLLQAHGSETELKESFHDAVDKLPSQGVDYVSYFQFDINHFLHEDGTGDTLNYFLSFFSSLARDDGFTYGELPATVIENQKGLMRFNCADSLDRTNLATFYFSLFMAAEWCKSQKVSLTEAKGDGLMPNEEISPFLVHFLAKAFIDSGNVISMLYTNTPAIKIEAIRKFSPSIPSQSSDTTVSMQRRVQNVVNDPLRQKQILLWTHPQQLSYLYRIDPFHLKIVPNKMKITEDILSLEPKPFLLDSGAQIDMILPMPMRLNALIFLRYPFRGDSINIEVTCGMTLENLETLCRLQLPNVEMPTWCKYSIGKTMRWGLDDFRCSYARFIRIKFLTDSPIIMGNIRVEAFSPFGPEPRICRKFCSEDSLERFKMSFDQFLKSDKLVKDAVELEKNRIGLEIPVSKRIELSQLSSVSPWFSDSQGRLLASNPSVCSLCGSPRLSPDTKFAASAILPGLFVKSEGGPKDLYICDNCKFFAEGISLQTPNNEEIYTESLRSPRLPLFAFEALPRKDRRAVLTTQPFCVILNYADGSKESALFFEGGSNVKVDGSAEFDLFFYNLSSVTTIEVEAESQNFSLKCEGFELSEAKWEGNVGRFEVKEPSCGDRVYRIKIEGNVTLKSIQVFGGVCPYQIEEKPAAPQVLNHKFNMPPPLQNRFDSTTRTDTYYFGLKGNIRTVFIEMCAMNGFSIPVSLALSFYLGEKLVKTAQLILPEAAPGTRLAFSMEEATVVDTVRVFYIDRIGPIKPHAIRFSDSPSAY